MTLKSEGCARISSETIQHHTETRGQDSRLPYQQTEESDSDITATEILDPYIFMSDHKMVDNPALLA